MGKSVEDAPRMRARAEAGVWESARSSVVDANRSFLREWSANDLFVARERDVRSRSRWIDEGPAELQGNRVNRVRQHQRDAGNARCSCEEWG